MPRRGTGSSTIWQNFHGKMETMADYRSSDLCSRCSELDLLAFVSLAPSSASSLIRRLRIVRDWTCPLCLFFASIANPHGIYDAERNAGDFHLRLTPASFEPYYRVLEFMDSTGAESLGRFIAPHHDNVPETSSVMQFRFLQKTEIDFEVLKHWIAFCDTRHTKWCATSKNQPPISNFRLIDCGTGEIIEASIGSRYVALSYVWGPTSTSGGSGGTFPAGEKAKPRYPRTIADVITVTSLLGFQYLWVDKYCINQGDSEDLHTQVSMMDIIYSSAFITIIAAAGDASFGLPGVSKPRTTPPVLTLEGTKWVAGLHNANALLKESVWSSRAWTYQEGYFSRRRLIFTHEQVVWECKALTCCESIDFSLSQSYEMEKSPFSNFGLFEKAFKDSGEFHILSCLNEYTKRHLSYQSDAINAMRGLFRALSSKADPVWQYWGIPTAATAYSRYRDWLIRNSSPGWGTLTNGQTSKWGPSDEAAVRLQAAFCYGLLWAVGANKKSKRRELFPSWSWAGWIAPVRWLDFDEIQCSPTLTPRVSAVTIDGKIELLTQGVIEVAAQQNGIYQHLLWLECAMMDFDFDYFEKGLIIPPSTINKEPYLTHFAVTRPLDSGFVGIWPLYLTLGLDGPQELAKSLREGGFFECLLLYKHIALIVWKKTESDISERIGLLDLHGFVVADDFKESEELELYESPSSLDHFVKKDATHEERCLRHYEDCLDLEDSFVMLA